MEQEPGERDLYYKNLLGIRRLIHRDISGAEVSPDGEKVLFFTRTQRQEPADTDSILYVFDLTRNEARAITGEGFYFLGWSPSGAQVAYATDKSVDEVNYLYLGGVDERRATIVGGKIGLWRKDDFEWVTTGGKETIRLSRDES